MSERWFGEEELRELSRGEPADVAATIVYLLGPGAAYVHGQVVRIDGGLGLTTGSLATGG